MWSKGPKPCKPRPWSTIRLSKAAWIEDKKLWGSSKRLKIARTTWLISQEAQLLHRSLSIRVWSNLKEFDEMANALPKELNKYWWKVSTFRAATKIKSWFHKVKNNLTKLNQNPNTYAKRFNTLNSQTHLKRRTSKSNKSKSSKSKKCNRKWRTKWKRFHKGIKNTNSQSHLSYVAKTKN